jgi:excisionase family DNA binding protein
MSKYADTSVKQLLFSPRQCAQALGCSVSLIRKFIRENKLASVRLGSNSKIPHSEILRLVRDGTAMPIRPRRKTLVQP